MNDPDSFVRTLSQVKHNVSVNNYTESGYTLTLVMILYHHSENNSV